MHFLSYAAAIAAVAVPASAWMPGVHKHIAARDGRNHFNRDQNGHGARPHPSEPHSKRWLPYTTPIRGVNLGSMFVFEPWIADSAWQSMCGNAQSEFDCVLALGQDAANSAFQSHWGSWITQSDFSQMTSYGLNTVRIPVGYWMMESIVYSDSEHFPQGGLSYLEQICGWAADAGMYIIIDLHGAPGAQVASNPDTGQYASSPGFYVDYQYDRATSFLSWITNLIHTNNNFRNVGMLEIVNEPVQDQSTTSSMLSSYYPNAWSAIRSAESSLGVASNNALHIEMMNSLWGSGNPNQDLSDTTFAAYDDHRYLKWDSSVAVSQSAYLQDSCTNNRNSDGDTPTIVGEFSLSVPDDVQDTDGWSTSTQQAFYKQWFAAQVSTYEKDTLGWIFWTWKSQLGDYRWSYQDAVSAGVIPTDITQVLSSGACDGF